MVSSDHLITQWIWNMNNMNWTSYHQSPFSFDSKFKYILKVELRSGHQQRERLFLQILCIYYWCHNLWILTNTELQSLINLKDVQPGPGLFFGGSLHNSDSDWYFSTDTRTSRWRQTIWVRRGIRNLPDVFTGLLLLAWVLLQKGWRLNCTMITFALKENLHVTLLDKQQLMKYVRSNNVVR